MEFLVFVAVIAVICLFKWDTIMGFINKQKVNIDNKMKDKQEYAAKLAKDNYEFHRGETLELIKRNTVSPNKIIEMSSEIDHLKKVMQNLGDESDLIELKNKVAINERSIELLVKKIQEQRVLNFSLTKYLEIVTGKKDCAFSEETEKLRKSLIDDAAKIAYDEKMRDIDERMEAVQQKFRLAVDDLRESLNESANKTWTKNSKHYKIVIEKMNKLAEQGLIDKEILR